MKASNVNEELSNAKKAIGTLGGQTDKMYSFVLPEEESERNIVKINKVKETPNKYPRKPGTPNKLPLE